MGDKMDYTIAADGEDGKMAKTWMAAAGQNGIPAAFVVGGDGTILWIGHPMGDLDKVLGEVLENKYDIKAAIAKQEREIAAEREFQAMMKPYTDAMKAKDYSQAVTELDNVMAKSEENKQRFAYTKFSVLLKADEVKAYSYASELANGMYKDNVQALNSLAWTIVDDKSKLSKPDYGVAVNIAKRAVEITKSSDPMILDTYAYALFKSGDVGQAIETQKKAVELAEKAGSDMDPALLKELKERLATFVAKKS
jgi:tetratricopeptide (TPR) repeat protein